MQLRGAIGRAHGGRTVLERAGDVTSGRWPLRLRARNRHSVLARARSGANDALHNLLSTFHASVAVLCDGVTRLRSVPRHGRRLRARRHNAQHGPTH